MPIIAAFALPHPPLIVPTVGHGREHEIQQTIDAYEKVALRIAELAPDTIVISSPHATLYSDYFQISPGRSARGNLAAFGAPRSRYQVTYDTALVGELCQICEREALSAGTDYEREPDLDHATMVPLHFIQAKYQDFKLVRIGLSGQSPAEHYRLGMAVQEAAATLGRRVVYVASGDLSHKLLEDGPYGFAPEGPVFDERITSSFAKADLLDILCMDHSLAERAAECGLRSFQIMAGALDGTPVTGELLSYEGPFGVGYGVAAFEPAGPEASDENRRLLPQYEHWRNDDLRKRRQGEDAYVRLARRSLEAFVREGVRIDPTALGLDESDLPKELLHTRAGCFVSLKVDGELRGCIGTISPVQKSLAHEICANAISAGTRDPRFMPVREDDLASLVYDVDVLGEPELCSRADLDPARFGVIVSTTDGRRGLLLPDLDGVDTVEQQIKIAAQKGGISTSHDTYQLERFQVVRHL